MRRPIRTALFAAADADVRRRLPFLLSACGISLLDAADNGLSALERFPHLHADLLISDVHLPMMDGNSLAEHVLCGTDFSVRPRVMLLYRREFTVPNRAKLEAMGAVYLAWPASEEDFRAAVRRLEMQSVFPEKRADRADDMLDALGFPAHAGSDALKYASLLCAEDERLLFGRGETLYPMVGKMLDLSSAAVERALRHAIGAAWRSDKFENQHRIFADTVDARRGQPTCGEMIARLADILRLEG